MEQKVEDNNLSKCTLNSVTAHCFAWYKQLSLHKTRRVKLRHVYKYKFLFASFHFIMPKKQAVTCEPLTPSNGASHGAGRCSNLPHVPRPPLAHTSTSLSLNLLFHLELSSTWVEQCSLKPLFYLCLFGEILLLLHLSCLWGWSHTCQFLRQIGITILHEHTTSPHHLPFFFFFVLIERPHSLSLFLLIIKELPILVTLVSSENCQ